MGHQVHSSQQLKSSPLTPVIICLACTVCIRVYVSRSQEPVEYLLFGYADHRFYIYSYFLWVIVLPILLLLGSWNYRDNHKSESHPSQKTTNIRLRIRNCGPWLLMVWFLYGPPWNISATPLQLNNHETVHLKGIQAVLRGAVPYVDGASSQYGPLLQLGAVKYLAGGPSGSLVGMREYWSFINLCGLIVVVSLIHLALRPRLAHTVSGLILLVPTFTFFGFNSVGFEGLFGWANSFRYVAPLLIACTILRLETRPKTNHRLALSFFVGCAVGIFSLISQENLIASFTFLLLATAVNLIISRQKWKSIVGIATSVVVGIFGTLAVAGTAIWGIESLRVAVRNYFFMPLAVQKGYSNSNYQISTNPCCTENLHHLPLFVLFYVLTLVAGIVLALVPRMIEESRFKESQSEWQQTILLWLASAIVQSAALTRMDSTHLRSALLLFPIWFVCFAHLIHSLWLRQLQRVMIRIACVAVAACLILASQSNFLLPDITEKIFHAFERRVVAIDKKSDRFSDLPLAFSELRRDDFERFVMFVRNFSNDKFVYIDPATSPFIGDELGLYYFLANLNPYPVPFDEQTLVITESEFNANLAKLRNAKIMLCILVTSNPSSAITTAATANRNLEFFRSVKIGQDTIYALRNSNC
jgi:hypothetical protein